MIKDTIGHVQPGAGIASRLLLTLAAWHRRTVRRRKRNIDCLGEHLRRDIAFPRRESERYVTDWLSRG